MITHTSGTTGVPKLVVHTVRTMGTRLRPQWWFLAFVKKRDTIAINVPFVHSRLYAAMALVLLRPPGPAHEGLRLRVGRRAVRQAQAGIHRGAAQRAHGLGGAHRGRAQAVRVGEVLQQHLRRHPPADDQPAAERSGRRGPRFVQIYGQSEVGPAVGRPYFRRSAHRMDGRCVGFPVPGCAKVRVVSRNGKRPSKDNPGSIEVRWDGIAHILRRAGSVRRQLGRLVAHRGRRLPHQGRLPAHARPGDGHDPDVGSSLEIEDVLLNRLERADRARRGDRPASPSRSR